MTLTIKEVKLNANEQKEDIGLGASVAVNGDTVAVGAIGANGGPTGSVNYAGAVFIFERSEGGRTIGEKWLS